MGWPAFLPRAYKLHSRERYVIKAGDIVTISLGVRKERYVITHIHDDGFCDLSKEQA